MKYNIFAALAIFYFNIKNLLAIPPEYYIDITFNDTGVNLQSDVRFFLYTRINSEEPQQLYVGNKSALEESAFSSSKPTKFMTHGWLNTHKGLNCRTVRKAFLAHDDYNVIVVDWGNIAKLPYMECAPKIKAVGGYIAKMIDFLESQGNNRNNMSLVGHSLGAQVMGLAGYQAANKVGHVVGLDAGGPGFYTAGPGEGISPESGQLVEIIHTNMDCLDVSRPAGHADFYPNGGGPKQPGCGEDANCYCAHDRAYVYYAEALQRPEAWLATRCQDYEAFSRGECRGNEILPFPGPSNEGRAKRGLYFLNTRDSAPYGLGPEGARPPGTETYCYCP